MYPFGISGTCVPLRSIMHLHDNAFSDYTGIESVFVPVVPYFARESTRTSESGWRLMDD